MTSYKIFLEVSLRISIHNKTTSKKSTRSDVHLTYFGLYVLFFHYTDLLLYHNLFPTNDVHS